MVLIRHQFKKKNFAKLIINNKFKNYFRRDN